jgi:ABC-type dipeptide/oligopeptide/nickel transport system ATPase component
MTQQVSGDRQLLEWEFQAAANRKKEPIQTMKLGASSFIKDIDAGHYPLLTLELKRRVKNKEACVVGVVGEAGSGKSYIAIQIARNIDTRFGINQIVFTYSAYSKEINRTYNGRSIMGLPIVFDEPSYAMGKREWYKEINQALVKTVESQRFLVRPLIIPIINLSLLDKTLRDYLVQFQVCVLRRGKAMVYRLNASQSQDKTYRYHLCNLEYPILDSNKCNIDTCLDCNKLHSCNFLRAQYERKKEAIQRMRYAQDAEKAKEKESKELTLDQLIDMIKPYESQYLEDGTVNQRMLRILFKEKLGIKVSNNRAYLMKGTIEARINNI